ncbi:hypothetical protein ILUMI_19227 [Ignelater luminosus]|uniref:Peptidase S1 domain-containing protein n=1 Tax=Ignelater luminosus TaxID=2038154 RepID=A0A8K0CKY2_IGNLU|nr:hypothetical protein ILUMI_19227 [Ignelater luminosus]
MGIFWKISLCIINLYFVSCYWFDKYDDTAEFFDSIFPISVSDYPYIASIVRRIYKGNNKFLCAGTIIGQLADHGVVLTTATCLNYLNMQNISIREVRIRTNSEYWQGCECELAQEYEIKLMQSHPQFSPHSKVVGEYDFAIIIINGQWKGPYDKQALRSKLKILPNSPDTPLTALGWSTSRKLQIESTDLTATANLMIISNSKCRCYFGFEISQQTFCIINKEVQKRNPCHLNAGGPLLTSNINETILKGIVLYAPTCQETLKPAIVLNTSLHEKLINNVSWVLMFRTDIANNTNTTLRFVEWFFPSQKTCDRKGPKNPKLNRTEFTLYLYTRKNWFKGFKLMYHSTPTKFFDATKESLFIIHGFKSSYEANISQANKHGALTSRDLNVFLVDWSGPATSFTYIPSAWAVGSIGQFLGEFIYKEIIQKFNVSSKQIGIIGYSLGAHLAGVAGFTLKNYKREIKYIIGLDPAKPCFMEEINEKYKRLHKGDAEFVHVLHTSTNYGIGIPLGTADYFFNDGINQPACLIRRGNVMENATTFSENFEKPESRKNNYDFYISSNAWAVNDVSNRGDVFASCSHAMSHKYLAQSFNSTSCWFIATRCNSWKDYKAGKCKNNSKSYVSGIDIDENARGVYFLKTGSDPPYCIRE